MIKPRGRRKKALSKTVKKTARKAERKARASTSWKSMSMKQICRTFAFLIDSLGNIVPRGT